MNHCPLCGETHLKIIQTIPVSKIKEEYFEKHRVDISPYLEKNSLVLLECHQCGLQSFDGIRVGDAFFYQGLLESHSYYTEEKNEFQFSIRKIKETNAQSVLDIACGEGAFLKKLQGVSDKRGTELDVDVFKRLAPFKIKSDEVGLGYDFITMHQYLEHVSEPKNLLTWAKSKLNSNGYLFAAVPNPDSEFVKFNNILDHPPHHMTRWTKKSLEKIASLVGLDIVEYFQEPVTKHYILWARHLRREQKDVSPRSWSARKLSALLDHLLYPFYSRTLSLVTQTHGILFRNRV